MRLYCAVEKYFLFGALKAFKMVYKERIDTKRRNHESRYTHIEKKTLRKTRALYLLVRVSWVTQSPGILHKASIFQSVVTDVQTA